MGVSPVDERSITAPYLAYYAFYHLRQKERAPGFEGELLSEKLLKSGTVRSTPRQLKPWLLNNDFQMSIDWVKRIDQVYLASVVFLLQLAQRTGVDNDFSRSFLSFKSHYNDFPEFYHRNSANHRHH